MAEPRARGLRLPPLRCESDELRHLDMLRFVAAFAVVIYHYRNQWVLGSGRTGSDIPNFEHLNLAVDLFFIISGVVITYVYGAMRGDAETGRFLQKRVARLAPLHWATLAFYVLIACAYYAMGSPPPDADKYDWSCLAPNFAMVHSIGLCRDVTFNGVSWSISAEMILYLCFPLFLVFLRAHRLLPLALGVFIAVALTLLGPAGPLHRPWHEWTFDLGAARALPPFLVGMSLWACRARLAKLIPYAPWVLALLLGVFAIGVHLDFERGWMLLLVYLIGAAGLAADIQGRVSDLVRVLAPFGMLTYGIYMLHPAIRTVVYMVIGKRLLHLDGEAGNAMLALSALLVVPAAYVSFFWFERPARRWISGLGRPAAPKPPQESGARVAYVGVAADREPQ